MKTGLVILGGGPAGLTAGMYAARARVEALLIERGATGGQMAATEWIDNYPGNVEPIYGYELAQKMESQARKFGLEILYKDIISVTKSPDGLILADVPNASSSAARVATMVPTMPSSQELPFSSTMSRSYSGAGFPMDPGFTGNHSKFARRTLDSDWPKPSRMGRPVAARKRS